MLGIGHAMVTRCYNTCFLLQGEGSTLLVDAGGGNGILRQLQLAEVAVSSIHHLFITHAHTDHVLGCVWLLRAVASCKDYEGLLHVWANEKAMRVLRTICNMTFSHKNLQQLEVRVAYHVLADGESFHADGIKLTCFDIHSTKEKQFGFRATMPDGKVVVCLGDEPFCEQNRPLVQHSDLLLSEAYCLYADRTVYRPYEKHHSTARDAGLVATSLQARKLLLYHSEDNTLASHKQAYAAEAAQVFSGQVLAPLDLECISF